MFNTDPYEARLHGMPSFIKTHRYWIEKVSVTVLGLKKCSLDEYLDNMLNLGSPLDEVGIFMFARMMHKHILVFFNDVFWCTRRDNDFTKCDAILCNQVANSANNSIQSSGEAKLLVLWIETDAVNMNYIRKRLGHLVPSSAYMHRSCIDQALIMQVLSRLSNQMSRVTCTLAMDQSKPIA